jgi:VanZ family protein
VTSRTRRVVLFAGCAAGIAALSLAPASSVPSTNILGMDKVEHAAAYAVLTALSFHMWRSLNIRRSLAFGGSVLLCTGYGVVMEIAQATLTTTRSAEAADALADAVGALFAISAIGIRERKR